MFSSDSIRSLAKDVSYFGWRKYGKIIAKSAPKRHISSRGPLNRFTQDAPKLLEPRAAIDFFWKEKFVFGVPIPALTRCGTECGMALVCSTGSPAKSTSYAQKVAEGEVLETNPLQCKPG
jgi:hypothetical protein